MSKVLVEYDELAFYGTRYGLRGDEFTDKEIIDLLEHLAGSHDPFGLHESTPNSIHRIRQAERIHALLERLSRTTLYLKLKLKEERHRNLQPKERHDDVATGD